MWIISKYFVQVILGHLSLGIHSARKGSASAAEWCHHKQTELQYNSCFYQTNLHEKSQNAKRQNMFYPIPLFYVMKVGDYKISNSKRELRTASSVDYSCNYFFVKNSRMQENP